MSFVSHAPSRSRSAFPTAPALVLACLMAVAPVALTGCGANKANETGASAPAAAAAKDGHASGAADSDAGAPARPFAGSASEATQLIGTAIDKKAGDVQKCVADYRVRKNLPHERVTISMGIDQEGRLLGATLPKGKSDNVLSDCLLRVLADAPFPRSHSGVISITKSYEEIVQ